MLYFVEYSKKLAIGQLDLELLFLTVLGTNRRFTPPFGEKGRHFFSSPQRDNNRRKSYVGPFKVFSLINRD